MAAWYLRHSSRGAWNVLLTVALVPVICILILRGSAEDPRVNIVKSKADLLALAPPHVPDDQNAAIDYAAAQKAKARFGGKSEDDPTRNLYKPSAFFESDAAQQHVAANQKAVELILDATSKAKCDFKLDYSAGFSMMLNHLSQMRDSARLLALQARLLAHAGKHAEAARMIAAIYRVAEHAATDPVLISGLVGLACRQAGDETIESILAWDTPARVEDVAVYRQALLQDRSAEAAFKKFWNGERCLMLYTLDALYTSPSPRKAMAGLGVVHVPGQELWYGSERRCINGVLSELIQTGGRFIKSEADVETLIERHQNGPAILARLSLPVGHRAALSFGRSEEQARVADAGLALLQFRLARGRDPKSLDELVPEFLPAVPHGYFHDIPIRLRIDPDGVLERDNTTSVCTRRDRNVLRVYTVGPDGLDQGGRDATRGRPSGSLWKIGSETDDDTNFCVPPMQRTPPEPLEAPK